MGIAPYKYFTFDGASSRDYDVYITGEGVFNAPERDVEMFAIPGRNGSYALDHGNFNNITVTYKAGMVDASESNFADKMSAVRNWLCSKVGYKRLSDDYNANEYRMAVFRSGVTVEHVDLKTGEFDITFECKPQRWLTSGETATTVANNGTLTNPTLFDSQPLIEVAGNGSFTFNNSTITVSPTTYGQIEIMPSGVIDGDYGDIYFDTRTSFMSSGNTIFPNSGSGSQINPIRIVRQVTPVSSGVTLVSASVASITGASGLVASVNYVDPYNIYLVAEYTPSADIQFSYNTTSLTINSVANFDITYLSGGTSTTVQVPMSVSVVYNTSTPTKVRIQAFVTMSTPLGTRKGQYYIEYNSWSAYSTKAISGANIDLENGEAYYVYNDEVVSMNNAVVIPSRLPVIPTGTTTFTYDNTITSFKVTPRWWKV